MPLPKNRPSHRQKLPRMRVFYPLAMLFAAVVRQLLYQFLSSPLTRAIVAAPPEPSATLPVRIIRGYALQQSYSP